MKHIHPRNRLAAGARIFPGAQSNFFRSGLIMLLALMAAASADALTLASTQNFDFAAFQLVTPNKNQDYFGDPPSLAATNSTVSFNQFDPALGNLIGVTITFNSTLSGASHIDVYSGAGTFTNAAFSQGKISCALTDSRSNSVFYGDSRQGSVFGATSVPFSGSFNGSLTPASLTAFNGTGQFQVLLGTTAVSVSGLTFLPYVQAYTEGNWAGSVTTTYTYALVPPLNLVKVLNQYRISWPTNRANGFVLEANTNLSVNAWSTVTNAVTLINDKYQVDISSTPGSRYFRLKK
jgi:hypothetical protein